jgi:hypothetical protein
MFEFVFKLKERYIDDYTVETLLLLQWHYECHNSDSSHHLPQESDRRP